MVYKIENMTGKACNKNLQIQIERKVRKMWQVMLMSCYEYFQHSEELCTFGSEV